MDSSPFHRWQWVVVWLVVARGAVLVAAEPLDVWPELAPGETTRHAGDVLPLVAEEQPPVTRVVNITRPTYTVHLAPEPNGAAVVILPGGGFGKVVPDKEGTEAAAWLNRLGVTAFVLRYRTTAGDARAGWHKPLQDAQRLMAVVRSGADHWGIDPDRLGLCGFSAGGQVAARLLCADGQLAYERIDAIDDVAHGPNFALLIYPWNLHDPQRDALVEGLAVPANGPPTFLVHTDDDRSSSLGTVLFYAALKRRGIPAALHVYEDGGHGYGLRPVAGSQIATWPDRAAHWLNRQIRR